MKHSKWDSDRPDCNADFWENSDCEAHIVDADFAVECCVFFPDSILNAESHLG
jgi:hypothetical protein